MNRTRVPARPVELGPQEAGDDTQSPRPPLALSSSQRLSGTVLRGSHALGRGGSAGSGAFTRWLEQGADQGLSGTVPSGNFLRPVLTALGLARPGLGWYEATRHTFASQWVMAGGSIEKLKENLGTTRWS